VSFFDDQPVTSPSPTTVQIFFLATGFFPEPYEDFQVWITLLLCGTVHRQGGRCLVSPSRLLFLSPAFSRLCHVDCSMGSFSFPPAITLLVSPPAVPHASSLFSDLCPLGLDTRNSVVNSFFSFFVCEIFSYLFQCFPSPGSLPVSTPPSSLFIYGGRFHLRTLMVSRLMVRL